MIAKGWVAAAVLALPLVGSGCQTYQVGQSLPSGFHMWDDVQYFPKGPRFPLRNELDAMQAAEVEHRRNQATSPSH